jgi:hypothetical protein
VLLLNRAVCGRSLLANRLFGSWLGVLNWARGRSKLKQAATVEV